MFKRLCLIGVGLIGGSIAKAACAHQLAQTIVGVGRQADLVNLKRAKSLQVIDEFYTDIETAVADADCIIIATPVTSTKAIFEQLKPFWCEQTIYSDVGSTKGSVIIAAQQVFGFVPPNFIPAHPIAGAEQSGVDAALIDLFLNKRLILTPTEKTDTQAMHTMRLFWEKMGAIVSEMAVVQHDHVLAATSHLPHILAFALVDMLGHRDTQEDIYKYAAGGFRDFTRIAASDPSMWQAICVANQLEISALIDQFKSELTNIQHLLETNNESALFELFSFANQARQQFLIHSNLQK